MKCIWSRYSFHVNVSLLFRLKFKCIFSLNFKLFSADNGNTPIYIVISPKWSTTLWRRHWNELGRVFTAAPAVCMCLISKISSLLSAHLSLSLSAHFSFTWHGFFSQWKLFAPETSCSHRLRSSCPRTLLRSRFYLVDRKRMHLVCVCWRCTVLIVQWSRAQ